MSNNDIDEQTVEEHGNRINNGMEDDGCDFVKGHARPGIENWHKNGQIFITAIEWSTHCWQSCERLIVGYVVGLKNMCQCNYPLDLCRYEVWVHSNWYRPFIVVHISVSIPVSLPFHSSHISSTFTSHFSSLLNCFINPLILGNLIFNRRNKNNESRIIICISA